MSALGSIPPTTRAAHAPVPMPASRTASALYEGQLRHRRFTPRPHRFTNRIFMAYLCLDTVDVDLAGRHGWSATRRAPLRFDARDFFTLDGTGPDTGVALAAGVRDLVEERTASRPTGPVCLLAHVRTFGWLFNPLSTYYCFDADGLTLHSVVLEVTNTPWGERCWYVVGGGGEVEAPMVHEVVKTMHVSPFFALDQHYRIRTRGAGAERLSLRFENFEGDDKVFDADLNMTRVELSSRSAWTVPARHAFMPLRGSALIYLHALVLWAKRVPFVRHPKSTTTDRPVEYPSDPDSRSTP